MGSENLKLKVLKLKDKNKEALKKSRDSSRKRKSLTASRDIWREKYRIIKEENKALKHKIRVCGLGNGKLISRHKYDTSTVSLCLNTYILCGCGFRSVVRVVEYLRVALGLPLAQIPCKSSIENWVQKCGLYLYAHTDNTKYKDGYGLIIDECMVIGQERMLVIMGVAANKGELEKSLSMCDTEVLLMEVKPSWTGEQVSECLKKVGGQMGTKPTYVISDNGSTLVKGVRDCGVLRILDCGHEIARQTEVLYKDDERLKLFSKDTAHVKLTEVMKPTSYLTPPKQRTIARFMNLSAVTKWAAKMLASVTKLNADEQNAYGFISKHREIIEELNGIYTTSNMFLKLLKNNGLSHKTIQECQVICTVFAQNAKGLPAKWIYNINKYLCEERDKLPDDKTVWNASSDILESIFGRFKYRKADNGLYGVTPLALTLPVMTRMNEAKHGIDIDFKEALEGTFMADLKRWNEDHLIENQVIRRRKALKT